MTEHGLKSSQTGAISELSDIQYSKLAQDTFDEIEHFFLVLAPILWDRKTTILQARIAGIVFARQMSGRLTTVASLAKDTGVPRSTVQNVVDRLISDGWMVSNVDPDDGRNRVVSIPKSRSSEVGAIEQLLMQSRLESFHRLYEILGENSGGD